MNYTVQTAVKREREPEIKGSKFYAYLVGLTDDAGVPHTVEMLQKPETPAPTVGQVLEGTIEPGRQKEDGTKWPDKFKKTKMEGGFRPRSPQETASIVRQHSQAMALRWIQVTQGPQITLDGLKPIIDWFDADVASVQSVPQTVEQAPGRNRPAAPEIPEDRAVKILDAAVEKKLARVEYDDDGELVGVVLTPSLAAKLIDVGVETGKIGNLNVDQAEAVEDWIEAESV